MNLFLKYSFAFFTSLFFITGCATTQARKTEYDVTSLQNQVQTLQNEVQAKDQQIQSLQYEVDSLRQQPQSPQEFSYSQKKSYDKSGIVRVGGVSVADVQEALTQAGLDPGPVDGKAGKKTRAAIKEFQKRNGLKADGIVGDRTWALLR